MPFQLAGQIGQIQVLDPEERRLLVEERNDTAAQTPAPTLVELLAAQAARTPETATPKHSPCQEA